MKMPYFTKRVQHKLPQHPKFYYFERKDLKGLQAFKQDFPIAKCYLIYAGSQQELHQDIMVLPIIVTLKNLGDILKC